MIRILLLREAMTAGLHTVKQRTTVKFAANLFFNFLS
jgi:hypothetical protein